MGMLFYFNYLGCCGNACLWIKNLRIDMAKRNGGKQKGFEGVLWDSANKLCDTSLPKLLSGKLRIKYAEKLVEGME